jgi:hypothetical protein
MLAATRDVARLFLELGTVTRIGRSMHACRRRASGPTTRLDLALQETFPHTRADEVSSPMTQISQLVATPVLKLKASRPHVCGQGSGCRKAGNEITAFGYRGSFETEALTVCGLRPGIR